MRGNDLRAGVGLEQDQAKPLLQRRPNSEGIGNSMTARRTAPWLLVLIGAAVSGPAEAQSNIDAGKSPAQIFATTCSACHRRPQELKRVGAGFLRSHYTTGAEEASAMAGYLASVGSDPRAVQERAQQKRVPAAAAPTPPGDTTTQPKRQPQPQGAEAKAPPGTAAKGRRGAASAAAAIPETRAPDPEPAPAAPPAPPLEEFEE